MKDLPWKSEWSETAWDQSLNARLDMLEYDVLRTEPMCAHQNLAIDETLLYRVAAGRRRPLLRIWDWAEPAVILGSYQSVKDEFDADVARREGFVFGRRISGGGAMVVQPDRSVTYSLIVPETVVEGLSFVQSFAFLDMWVIRALRALDIPATYKPINDIASPKAKIGGAAQCRRQKTVLHHATLAYDMDRELMWELLRLGRPKLNTKGIASAVKEVTPLNSYTSLPREKILDHLENTFTRMFKTHPGELAADERSEANHIMGEKFKSEEWLHRVL